MCAVVSGSEELKSKTFQAETDPRTLVNMTFSSAGVKITGITITKKHEYSTSKSGPWALVGWAGSVNYRDACVLPHARLL